jgi:hypothetical protein
MRRTVTHEITLPASRDAENAIIGPFHAIAGLLGAICPVKSDRTLDHACADSTSTMPRLVPVLALGSPSARSECTPSPNKTDFPSGRIRVAACNLTTSLSSFTQQRGGSAAGSPCWPATELWISGGPARRRGVGSSAVSPTGLVWAQLSARATFASRPGRQKMSH